MYTIGKDNNNSENTQIIRTFYDFFILYFEREYLQGFEESGAPLQTHPARGGGSNARTVPLIYNIIRCTPVFGLT